MPLTSGYINRLSAATVIVSVAENPDDYNDSYNYPDDVVVENAVISVASATIAHLCLLLSDFVYCSRVISAATAAAVFHFAAVVVISHKE